MSDNTSNTAPVPHARGSQCTQCTNFEEWVANHCYDCGGDVNQPGPWDRDHILCFATVDDLADTAEDLTLTPQPPHPFESITDYPKTCNICRQPEAAHVA